METTATTLQNMASSPSSLSSSSSPSSLCHLQQQPKRQRRNNHNKKNKPRRKFSTAGITVVAPPESMLSTMAVVAPQQQQQQQQSQRKQNDNKQQQQHCDGDDQKSLPNNTRNDNAITIGNGSSSMQPPTPPSVSQIPANEPAASISAAAEPAIPMTAAAATAIAPKNPVLNDDDGDGDDGGIHAMTDNEVNDLLLALSREEGIPDDLGDIIDFTQMGRFEKTNTTAKKTKNPKRKGKKPSKPAAAATTASGSTTTKNNPSLFKYRDDLVYSGRPKGLLNDREWPEGWTQKSYRRKGGATVGRDDHYWYTPATQIKLRSILDVERFLLAMDAYGGDEKLAKQNMSAFGAVRVSKKRSGDHLKVTVSGSVAASPPSKNYKRAATKDSKKQKKKKRVGNEIVTKNGDSEGSKDANPKRQKEKSAMEQRPSSTVFGSSTSRGFLRQLHNCSHKSAESFCDLLVRSLPYMYNVNDDSEVDTSSLDIPLGRSRAVTLSSCLGLRPESFQKLVFTYVFCCGKERALLFLDICKWHFDCPVQCKEEIEMIVKAFERSRSEITIVRAFEFEQLITFFRQQKGDNWFHTYTSSGMSPKELAHLVRDDMNRFLKSHISKKKAGHDDSAALQATEPQQDTIETTSPSDENPMNVCEKQAAGAKDGASKDTVAAEVSRTQESQSILCPTGAGDGASEQDIDPCINSIHGSSGVSNDAENKKPAYRLAEKLRVSTCKFADRVAQISVDLYKSTIPFEERPPQTCLATIVAHDAKDDSLKVVGMGVGTKFLKETILQEEVGTDIESGSRMLYGERVRDMHAEVLARRSFRRALTMEILSDTSGYDKAQQSNRILVRSRGVSNEGKHLGTKYKLRSGVTLHLYSSSAPCGNACLKRFCKMTKEKFNDYLLQDEWPKTIHEPLHGSAVKLGEFALLLKKDNVECESLGTPRGNSIESGDESTPKNLKGVIPKGKVWPANQSDDWTPPGTTIVKYKGQKGSLHTCSDKICRWNFLGIQGSLLARLLEEPLYVSTVTVGRKLSAAVCRRAVCCRLDAKSRSLFTDTIQQGASGDEAQLYHVNHPAIMGTAVYLDDTAVVETSSDTHGQDVRFHSSMTWAWWPQLEETGSCTSGGFLEYLDGNTGLLMSKNRDDEENVVSQISTQSLTKAFHQAYEATQALVPQTLASEKPTLFRTLKELRDFKKQYSPTHEQIKEMLLSKHKVLSSWNRRWSEEAIAS